MIKLIMKTLIWEPCISQGSPEKQIQKDIYLFVCYRSWLTDFAQSEGLRTKGPGVRMRSNSESLGTQAGEDGCLSLSRESKSAFFHLLVPLTPSLDWLHPLALKIVFFALSMDSTTNVFQRVPHKLINNVLPAILDISKPS